VEPLPDLRTLSDDELKGLIDELENEENEISYRRRILHGKIDILKAELQARLRKAVDAGEGSSIVEANLEKLTEILARKAAPPA
jgi:RsiG-like